MPLLEGELRLTKSSYFTKTTSIDVTKKMEKPVSQQGDNEDCEEKLSSPSAPRRESASPGNPAVASSSNIKIVKVGPHDGKLYR